MRDDADEKYPLDQLRHIEGFPIGEDEDLHALSDPPHYTAYPNPHIAEFIEKWQSPFDDENDEYHREPYVADVSEGKSGAIYYCHSYHTKVPHKAIMKFVDHYTESGDIVFDGFCGTGMTGVAAQLLGRRAVLVDLCPAATFIAYNYNSSVDVATFKQNTRRIINEVESECGWMYETWHPHCNHPNRTKGRIHYTIWSDVFVCPYCHEEFVFWEAAVDADTGKLARHFNCLHCNAEVAKRDLTRAYEQTWDRALQRHIERAKQVPVRINYSVGRNRRDKKPDEHDLAIIDRIEASQIPYWYPTDRMPQGDESRRNDSMGITHVHHFYTRRNLWAMSALVERARRGHPRFLFLLSSINLHVNKMRRYQPSKPGGTPGLPGTLYISAIPVELPPFDGLPRKKRNLLSSFDAQRFPEPADFVAGTQSATDLSNVPDDSVDYIFTDPPFGSNLMYSELNFLWEAWLRAFTNNQPEAIVNDTQSKDLGAYRDLMTQCFTEMYRILKPGRWATVVFHNSKASIWNAIQEGLAKAGFLVAQVTVMDKKQGTFKQVTSPGTVKNDLVINAYKPRKAFQKRFLERAGYGLEREFVAQHLRMLPVEPNLERTAQMLNSKLLAYYIQHGYEIALDADEFYDMLDSHFLERDGFWFLNEEQVQEYERRKATVLDTKGKGRGKRGAPLAQSVLFISDERSAIAWLYHFLETPKDYNEIYTAFVKALQVPEDQIPEIKTLLEENFVRVNGEYKRPEKLEKRELEARRQKRLLREFEDILEKSRRGQQLEDVRKEAVLAGFTKCYREKRFDDILRVGHKLDDRIVESSTEIYDFIDIAEAKVG